MAESIGGSRRQRWAERENRRPEGEYRLQYERWQRVDGVLERWLTTARTFGGSDAGEWSGLGIVLRRGERLFGQFPGVALVEVNRASGVFAPAGYVGHFSALHEADALARPDTAKSPATPPAEQPAVREHGDLIITGSRVIFRGASRNREWAFGALIGIEHAIGHPVTLIHVSSRKKVSGFAVTAGPAPEVRFLLTLALAHFQHDVAGFVAALETERARHAATQPIRPALARPEQTPGGLAAVASTLGHFYFGRPGQPRGRRIAQGTATVLGTLILIGLVTPETTSTGPTGPTASVALPTPTTIPAPTTTVVSPSTVPSTSVATTVPRTTVARPTPTPTIRRTTPRPAPTAPRIGPLCGAPANPYGYNFCGRGVLIYTPKAGTCTYFDCIDNFGESAGYMIQCDDGMFSTAGGRQGACSHHGGVNRPVYSGP